MANKKYVCEEKSNLPRNLFVMLVTTSQQFYRGIENIGDRN